jgi:hypothetical protein
MEYSTPWMSLFNPSGCDDSCNCNVGYAGNAALNQCAYCNSGYSDTNGLTSCKSCPSCGGGAYRSGCGGTSSGTCLSCSPCPLGQFRSGCGGTSAGTCLPCPTNTFSAAVGESCRACEGCPAGYMRVNCGGSSGGSCVGVPCSGAGTLQHGTISASNGGRYPSTATYSCQPGYSLSGLQSRSCSTGGVYEGSVPTCVGIPCAALTFNGNTPEVTNNGNYPSTAAFSCQPGVYERLPSGTRE